MLDSPESVSADLLDNDRYLEAAASFGDKRSLVAAQPIYSTHGIKLLDTGARIDTRILGRLFGHKLAEPLDRCVASEDAIRPRDIAARARELVAEVPLLAYLEAGLGAGSARLWSAWERCPLPPAIAIRLTVARDTATDLYEHSLRCTFVAAFIGLGGRFSDRDLQLLVTAGLLHDMGMMHADPAQYEGGKALDPMARRALLAHPLTAQLIAQREPLLSPAVASALAEHHERVDGSGYPRGLHGDAIGKHGRALALAEVVTGVVDRHPDEACGLLAPLLRFNRRSFDGGLCDALLAALPRTAPGEAVAAAGHAAFDAAVARIDSWKRISDSMQEDDQDAATAFIDARIDRLGRWLADAGVDDPQAAVLAAQDEPVLQWEIAALAREAGWHLRQIAYEVSECWPQPPSSPIGEWIAMIRESTLA